MAQYSYQRLNPLSGPKAARSQWGLYVFCTLVDLAFLVLALIFCQDEVPRVKWWLLVKSSGAMVYRFISLIGFAINLATCMELFNRIRSRDFRFKYQIVDPSAPRYDVPTFIYAAFELVCILGTMLALASASTPRQCNPMTLTAAISTAIALLKYVTCIYSGCVQCRRNGHE